MFFLTVISASTLSSSMPTCSHPETRLTKRVLQYFSHQLLALQCQAILGFLEKIALGILRALLSNLSIEVIAVPLTCCHSPTTCPFTAFLWAMEPRCRDSTPLCALLD